MIDKRQYVRFDTEGSAMLDIGGAHPYSVEARLIDISFKGVGCLCTVDATTEIEANAPVRLTLMPKSAVEPIIGQGKVRYVRQEKEGQRVTFRIGIEFDDIDRHAVRTVVNELQNKICSASRKKAA